MKKVFSLMLLLATIFTFTSCGGDDEPQVQPKLTQFDYTIFAGESTPVKGEALENLTWEGDNFVAEIDNKGILHANKTGYARIWSKDITGGDLTNIRVVVTPRNTSFSEPLLYHSGVGSQIKYEDGYFKFDPMSYGSMPKADMWGIMSSFITHYIKECGLPWTLYKQDASSMIFKTDKSASPYVIYLFDSNREVVAAGVYINPLQMNSLPDFLNERYLIYDVDTSNYTANFAHAIGYSGEPIVDYVGQMGYSSSLGLVIIAYTKGGDASRSNNNEFMDVLKNIEL